MKRIEKSLSLLTREGKIHLWVDRNVEAGEEWEKNLFSFIETSNLAILVLSNDFLSSDFILSKELPAMFAESERRRLTLIPILVRPCPFELHRDLSKFQFFNDPAVPLSSLREWEIESELSRLAVKIAQISS